MNPAIKTENGLPCQGQAADLRPLLERFVDKRILDPSLYEAAVSVATSCLKDKTGKTPLPEPAELCEKAADLAGDFLLHLRAESKRDIQTRAGLRREMA